MPRIDAALEAGRLSYCKVRAMTRVATPANEVLLLSYAETSTGAQLEKICRGLRRVERRASTAAARERFARRRHRPDGMVRIELQLHPDEAEVVWQALHASKQALVGQAPGAGRDVDDLVDLSAERSAPTLADAAVALAEQRLATEAAGVRAGAERRMVLIQVREDALADDGVGLRAELHDGTPLSGPSLLRIACDCSLAGVKTDDNGEVLAVGAKRRAPSVSLMRALRVRDRACVFPGCTSAAYLEAHHVEHWAQGGPTTLDNLTLLCWSHHEAVHEGGFRVERDDGELRFFEPGGRPIEAVPVPAPAAPERDGLAALVAAQRTAGIEVDGRTALPRWHGEPLDLPGAVRGLVRCAEEGVRNG